MYSLRRNAFGGGSCYQQPSDWRTRTTTNASFNFYDENGEFKLDKETWRSSLSPVDHFLFFRLLNAFPQEWRKELKLNRASIYGNTQHQNLSSFTLYVDGKKKSLEKLFSKSLYQIFVSKISCKPTAMKKYDKAFNTDTSHLDWEKIYLLPFKTTLHTKLREFQYKILNRILYTNDMLFKFKKVDSPLCYFCGKELETLEHLFFCCPKVHVFWNEVAVMLNSHGITFKSLDIKDILFGFFDARNHDSGGSLLNYIVLESKYFIYRTKLNKTSLSLKSFFERIKNTFQIERFIATKNNKLEIHQNKWKPLLPLIEK